MNDESLQRANDFLAAVSERVAVGEVLQETPAEIGRVLGLPDPLSTARAVRALASRAEMAESNLRALLATARSGGNATKPQDAPVGDAEMAAILGVLRGDEDEDGDGEERRGDDGSETSDATPAAATQPPTAA